MRQLMFPFMHKKRGGDKYTDEQVEGWVKMFNGGMSYKQVADLDQVPYPTVFWHIKKRQGLSGRKPGGRKKYVGKTEAEVARIRNLKRYGITPERYEELLAQQSGVCAICGRSPKGGATCATRLNVDHDHVTGKVRGLLCHDCNPALGKFKDSVELLEKVISYLRSNS